MATKSSLRCITGMKRPVFHILDINSTTPPTQFRSLSCPEKNENTGKWQQPKVKPETILLMSTAVWGGRGRLHHLDPDPIYNMITMDFIIINLL